MDESSDDFDNICPLCMEEMDATDRHLKPCHCGYQICVWCWHQVIGLAAKENTEGRCPACRTPYDKDKVVGTRLSCADLEFTVDKKKSHKSKSKQEGRKQLCNVRVVQRNLVYIVGFPLNLADEETLERREFFGQYGKILKVAVSRQNSHNGPSASVYVTFVRDEDAVKCIKAVDGCLFEGKLLRACFGTNKYCNAWLKNLPCNNPECLYLHDEGPDEDSYTKEEMITNKSQFHDLTKPPHRAVGVLPPPVFEAGGSSVAVSAPAAGQSQQTPSKASVAAKAGTCSAATKVTSLPPAASWGMRGSSAKPGVKLQAPAPKKRQGAAGGGPETLKAEVPVKELEESEPANNVSACEQDDYSFSSHGDSDHVDSKVDIQTDSSQGSSSPENNRYAACLDLHCSVGDSGAIYDEGSSNLLHVGDMSISLNADIPMAPLITPVPVEQPEPARRDDSDDVLSALERIDLNAEVAEAGMSSAAGVADVKRRGGEVPSESNIIADILTMDFGAEGALSPGELAKLYLKGKSPHPDASLLESPVSWKPKQQSRFSFARHGDAAGGQGLDLTASSQTSSYEDGFYSRELPRSHSLQSQPAGDSGHNSALKSRLFAPPGFAGTTVPPPGFAVRNANSVPPSPAGNRLNDFDFMDPAIMAVGRGPLQSELARTVRVQQPKPDVRQVHDPESLLGLELMQQQGGFVDFGSLIKQQQQQQHRHEARKVPLKYPADELSILHGEVGSLARLSGQYDNSYMYSPGSARNFRSMSSLDNGWGGGGGYGGGAENLVKFKRGLSGGAMLNALRQGDGSNSGYFSNGNQALAGLEHYMGDADIQGAFV